MVKQKVKKHNAKPEHLMTPEELAAKRAAQAASEGLAETEKMGDAIDAAAAPAS